MKMEKDLLTSAGGFTLMELLIVLGILGLLAGLTAPAIQGARKWISGRESRLLFMELESACRLYRMENGEWPFPLAGGEKRLNADEQEWRSALAPYMERQLVDRELVDGLGNTDIRLILDAEGDHWIGGDEFIGLKETERPERIWARLAIYSLNPDGSLSASSWDRD